MPGKANASKRKSQQLKRTSKQRADEEGDLPENEVGITVKRNRSHAGHLSSKVTGQAKCTYLKRIKIASNKRSTWQPVPKSTGDYLQSLMESVILEILSKNIKGKEEIQYHLNCLKKRSNTALKTWFSPSTLCSYLYLDLQITTTVWNPEGPCQNTELFN
ncbi:Centromere protein Q [Lemmus lemmus]